MDIPVIDTSIFDIPATTTNPQLPAANETKSTELDQDSFMKLMLTQLEYQDPLKPVDNTEFIAQTAQFSSVAGINSMRDSLDKFVADQSSLKTLFSANLLGKTAMITTSEISLKENTPIDIEYTLPQQAESVSVLVLDQTGAMVQRKELGTQGQGTHTFTWDGIGDDDSQLAPGDYSIRVEYPNSLGDNTAAQTSIATKIDSVSFGTSGTGSVLTTSEGREIQLSEVTKIKNT